MAKKSKKKKIVWQQYMGMVFFMLIGACGGILIARYIDQVFETDNLPRKIIWLAFTMYAAIFVQLIIHESGHLIFGLLSGYKFCSFRIMSFMWIRENGKIKFRRLTVAGTGGQCLMVPPDFADGKIPVALYNLGGSLMNMIASFLFLGVYFAFKSASIFSLMMPLFSVFGFGVAIMNGIPMRMGTVDNDGYNAFALTRNRKALYSFWVQMKINEQLARGLRLKDMPDEWFMIPSDEEMKNSMVAALGVLACNRLMDEQRIEEADKLMEHLLEIESGIVGLHRNLMICDRMYVELINENRRQILDEMNTKEQKKFMKAMKNFPSVLRTKYVYALLCERDIVKADEVKVQFEKCAKTYPYPNDIQSERELMEKAAALKANL